MAVKDPPSPEKCLLGWEVFSSPSSHLCCCSCPAAGASTASVAGLDAIGSGKR